MPRYRVDYTETLTETDYYRVESEEAAEECFATRHPFDCEIDEITEVPD